MFRVFLGLAVILTVVSSVVLVTYAVPFWQSQSNHLEPLRCSDESPQTQFDCLAALAQKGDAGAWSEGNSLWLKNIEIRGGPIPVTDSLNWQRGWITHFDKDSGSAIKISDIILVKSCVEIRSKDISEQAKRAEFASEKVISLSCNDPSKNCCAKSES